MPLIAQILVLAAVANPMARAPVCVDVAAPEADRAGLRALVASEVDRRPNHRAALEGEACRSHLRVELVEVAGDRYVTGRLGGHIPHREHVADEPIAAVVERVVSVVMHNDPIQLEGPASSPLGGWVRSLRRRGHNLYGVEAFQILGLVRGLRFSLPGMALRLRREVGATQVGVRLAYATRLSGGSRSNDLKLLDWVSFTLEAGWYPMSAANISPYLSVEAGLALQRFGGPPQALAPTGDGYEVVRQQLITLGTRLGLEVLRTTDMRANLFVAAQLPVMPSSDELGVIDAWVPSVSVGTGVAF